MRSLNGWQPAQPGEGTCVRLMAGKFELLPHELLIAQCLPMICPWSAHDLPMIAPIFTGGRLESAQNCCTCNFFRFSKNSEKSRNFLKKIRFFLYFSIFFSKTLNLWSPNTPFGTSTVDKKKLQFLRNEDTHKKEKHAATYDVVGARPSCIWKARWSVVSLNENRSFSKYKLKHRSSCTYLVHKHNKRLRRHHEFVREMLEKS